MALLRIYNTITRDVLHGSDVVETIPGIFYQTDVSNRHLPEDLKREVQERLKERAFVLYTHALDLGP